MTTRAKRRYHARQSLAPAGPPVSTKKKRPPSFFFLSLRKSCFDLICQTVAVQHQHLQISLFVAVVAGGGDTHPAGLT